MPHGGICCNQPVDDYVEAQQQQTDTHSSSAARPAPVGGVQKEDVSWLLDTRLVEARDAWQRMLQNMAAMWAADGLDSSCGDVVDEGVLLLRLRRFAPSLGLTVSDSRPAAALLSWHGTTIAGRRRG